MNTELSQVNKESASRGGFQVKPSDYGQSVFRIILVTLVLAWTSLSSDFAKGLESDPVLTFTIFYWLVALVLHCWTVYFLLRRSPSRRWFNATRIFSAITDVIAASSYTALAGNAGVVLYPVFLTISIGYGYRFGIGFLYLTVILCALGFTIAANYNVAILENPNLLMAYYLGMLLVPLYSSVLLNKHMQVLMRIREVNLARSRFIANMSHELRTPLHAIISVSDLLREDNRKIRLDENDSSQKLLMISDSAQHLLNLVNRVLDIASAEANGFRTNSHERIPLFETVISSIRISKANAKSKELGFYWQYDINLPTSVISAQDSIQEILINTIGNAIKYTDSGYVFVSFDRVDTGKEPKLRILVVDTGIGISDNLLPTIFEPFTLGDDSANRQYSGTGLGLTLTKQFVEELGGEIKFRSMEGVGTECEIMLPIDGSEFSDRPSCDSLMPCVLLSPRLIDGSVLRKFEESGWECSVFSDVSELGASSLQFSAVFIDVIFGARLDSIAQYCSAQLNADLIFSYGTFHDDSVESLLVNVIVNDSKSELAHARYLAATKVELDGAELEESRLALRLDGISILVADDNIVNLQSAKLALESVGAKVTTVASGEDALTELENGNYKLAFVDLHMPGMSGVEVCQIYQYLLSTPRTPIIILTADATEHARREARDAGALELLTKPLRISKLRETAIAHALDFGSDVNVGTIETLIDERVIFEFLSLNVERSEIESMIDMFETDASHQLSELLVAITKDDTQSAQDILHSLKGSASTLGASEFHNQIQELYSRARTGKRISSTETDTLFISLTTSAKELRSAVQTRT